MHTVLDLENRVAVEAHSQAMLFRGYEVILKGRDPRDAIDISSRACGVCGGVHATVSSLAIEQAFDICPPPLGVEVDTQETQGKLVIRIQVPRGDDPPYAIDENKIYVRDDKELICLSLGSE